MLETWVGSWWPRSGILEYVLHPNSLTLMSIASLYLMYSDLLNGGWTQQVTVIILLAFVGDGLDGMVARSTNRITTIGKIIDPLRDKLVICLAVWYLFWTAWIIDIVLVVVVISIESILISLRIRRLLYSTISHTPIVECAATDAGKYKMILQSMAVVLFIMFGSGVLWLSRSLLYVAVWFALGSLNGQLARGKYAKLKS